MKWIKKNKFTVIAIVAFVVLTILGFKLKEILFPNQRTAIYGDRLDGKVFIDSKVYDTLRQRLTEKDKVKSVTITENGKRIDIVVTVEDDLDKNNAKKLIDGITEPFNESQIGYYDFQVFIRKDNTSENDFPIIGYKHHNSSSFSWSKDRDKTEEEG